ncbi:hypothetical protein LOD99_8933 [Oopsacas minuta]|uniref:Uncharacterized protein n=1 Tax=Oopsacas minuta TaxID=111878 RepID=A0AAV7JEW4_9METZ|nr:hypothetical protein LOD99_8933 [Oopsacas minuta]
MILMKKKQDCPGNKPAMSEAFFLKFAKTNFRRKIRASSETKGPTSYFESFPNRARGTRRLKYQRPHRDNLREIDFEDRSAEHKEHDRASKASLRNKEYEHEHNISLKSRVELPALRHV